MCAPSRPALEKLRPRGREQEQRSSHSAEHVLEQIEQLSLGPVNVLHEDDRRPLGYDVRHELGPGVLKAVAGCERVQIPRDVETERQPENLAVAESLECDFWRVALQEAQVLLQDFAEGPIRRSRSVRETSTRVAQRLGALVGKALPELAREPCLADARIAENRYEAGPTLVHDRAVSGAEAVEVPIAADERVCEAADAARPHERERTHDALRGDSLRLAFRLDDLRRIELESPAGRGHGALTGKDHSWAGRLLQASGRHDRVAGELLDRPAGAVDFLRHRIVEAFEQNARALRILGTG